MINSLSVAVVCRAISNLCGVATAFLGIRLYNLYVSKEIYGTILVGLQIISYLPLMSGGFRMVLNQQMLAESDASATQATARFGQTLQTYFLIFVLLAGMGGMALYSQLPGSRATGISVWVFIAAGAAAAFTFQAGSQLALLVALGEQVKSSLIQGAWGVLTVGVLWASFAVGLGVWAFPASNGISALLVIVIVRIALLQTANDVPLLLWARGSDFWPRFWGIWRPAFDCLSNQIATVLVFTLDIIFVGILVGAGAAAVYGVVSRVMGISRQVLQSLAEAAWPRLTQERDEARKAEMMKKVDRLNAWLVGAWFGAMAGTLHTFLSWLVKPDWVAGPVLLGLILARHFVVSLTSPHAYGLLSLARFKDLARVNEQEALFGLIVGTVLSLKFGSQGTALAFLLGTCAFQGWQMTREYFRFAGDTHWFAEWLAVVGRGLVGAGCSVALTAACLALMRGALPSAVAAVLAGAVGFCLPMAVILFWWRRWGRAP